MNRIVKHVALALGCLSLIGCEESQQQNVGALLGGNEAPVEAESFTPVMKGVEITFPADHQAHLDFRHEWWYLTANLTDEKGNPLGVQWTQFRFAAVPQKDEPAEKKAVWQSHQIFMAHNAITTKDKHYADEKWSRDHSELAGVDASPFRVYLDDWQWKSSTNDLFPATLKTNSKQFGYSLTLTSNAPYQKQGEQGYSTKSSDGQAASHYYSQPFIDVEGEVTIDGETHQVSGKGWIDREWSSQYLHESQQGWDWFALRLTDETSLVVFQLRDSRTGQASYSHAKLMHKDGSGIAIQQNNIHLEATKQTQIEGRNYPTEWQLSIPDQQVELTISALNPKAQMPLSVTYWEGPVTIDGSHSGTGYMELTGY
ncbi:carotenoid 1,2-hydratase [Vibrio sp. J1-1]|uniref:lipocalin-like domain-containing protein n=1 Tax=Vibrio sp. J1-1 TaxID=2912251 RepID=UPI001F3F15DA|nr:lipocalin-like domain-containing protein [Vibrio sp. J1-1]MBR9874984.1 carotenoid 1,2-hydratase [Vibrionaceae bacterium]MCF7480542.1 carotenoid 1,2-hydratase [Vibrio sp. J1-1]